MNTIIEKIRAEIERLIDSEAPKHDSQCDWEDGYFTGLFKSLTILDTLKEQPVKTNIVEDLKHYLATTPKDQIEKDWESLKEWGNVGPSVSEFLGWKQSVCEGLEEEYKSYVEDDPVYSKLVNRVVGLSIAHHFAQWGAEHRGSSEIPKQLDEDAVDIADALLAKPKDYALSAKADYWNGAHDGVIAGAKWQKEMMLKEAVEGEVKHFATAHYVLTNEDQLTARLKQFQDGDKVRIIIVKED